jgi:hypothetical protein
VSLSWRNRVRIALAPHRVSLVRLAHGTGPRANERKEVTCVRSRAARGWNPALEALREMLDGGDRTRGSATVVLSNQFVRYLVLPWMAELVTQAEELEFARARYAKVFGEASRQWDILLNPAAPGQPRLTAAIDSGLLAALSAALACSRLQLTAVEPLLATRFNEARRRIDASAWLVIAEHGWLLMAWISRGQWHSVRSRPIHGAIVPLAQVLEQERLLLGAEDNDAKVHVWAEDEVAVDLAGIPAGALRDRDAGPSSRGDPVVAPSMLEIR